MDKKSAIVFLSPYFDRIIECIKRSMQEYVQLYKADERIHTTTTVANLIQNRVVYYIERVLEKESGVTPIRTANQFLLNINGQVNLRFKKLKKNLTSSNYPTKRSKKFGTYSVGHGQMEFVFDKEDEEKQEKQRRIEHLLDTTDVGWTVGWVLNKTVTEAHSFITWPENSKKNHWYIDIESELGKVIQIPQPAKEEKKPKKRRVRVKGKNQQKGKKKRDGTDI